MYMQTLVRFIIFFSSVPNLLLAKYLIYYCHIYADAGALHHPVLLNHPHQALQFPCFSSTYLQILVHKYKY